MPMIYFLYPIKLPIQNLMQNCLQSFATTFTITTTISTVCKYRSSRKWVGARREDIENITSGVAEMILCTLHFLCKFRVLTIRRSNFASSRKGKFSLSPHYSKKVTEFSNFGFLLAEEALDSSFGCFIATAKHQFSYHLSIHSPTNPHLPHPRTTKLVAAAGRKELSFDYPSDKFPHLS